MPKQKNSSVDIVSTEGNSQEVDENMIYRAQRGEVSGFSHLLLLLVFVCLVGLRFAHLVSNPSQSSPSLIIHVALRFNILCFEFLYIS